MLRMFPDRSKRRKHSFMEGFELGSQGQQDEKEQFTSALLNKANFRVVLQLVKCLRHRH